MSFTGTVPNPRTLAVSLFVFLLVSVGYFLYNDPQFATRLAPAAVPESHFETPGAPPATEASKIQQPSPDARPMTEDIAQYFIDFPLKKPFRNTFGELGRRTRVLRDWIVYQESQPAPSQEEVVLLEQAASSLFPFLKKQPRFPDSTRPFRDLRSSFEPGSAGIVIPTGDGTVRFAAHLIVSIRSALGSTLPIQIIYAGDSDLSADNKKLLIKLTEDYNPSAIEFVDLYTLFHDDGLNFTSSRTGGWATKPFAALGSRFEKVIVLDADAVFLQQPEVLLNHEYFRRSGTLLFHDRLLWQGRFQDRHKWWADNIPRPSATLNKSLVWTENYAEECDSGVVVLDKGRLDVLMGLLHTCWQNSFEVREDITYKITYGDKETWWMGLEMAGAPYDMARYYGGIVGWKEKWAKDGSDKVCSFVIAHVDTADRLIWYNGGLLKNKLTDKKHYEVPTSWQIDGVWEKGGSKEAMSCMVNGTVHELDTRESKVLEDSVEKAKWVDGFFTIG